MIYAFPGQPGAKVQFKSKYDNFIGGKWVPPVSGEYFDVITATNGVEALAICEKAECDMVLLDVMMPDMDGFEVCRRLKADISTAHIPVVMVTALDQPADRIKGLDAGAVHARATIPLTGDDTTESVWSTLSDIGADLLVAQLRDGLGEPVEQVGEITYAKKLSTDDLRIDWTAPAVIAERVVRCSSRTPSRVSSLVTSLLTADGVRPSVGAAAEKPLASTTRTKAAISPA